MADKIDGVKLALLSNRLEGISRKMGNTLMRTGRSGVLNIARDFSCCILTADDKLAAVAESLPIHVLSGPDMMAAMLKLVFLGCVDSVKCRLWTPADSMATIRAGDTARLPVSAC